MSMKSLSDSWKILLRIETDRKTTSQLDLLFEKETSCIEEFILITKEKRSKFVQKNLDTGLKEMKTIIKVFRIHMS